MKVTPRVTPSVLFSLAVFLFFGYFVWQAREWRLQARLYPWSIGIPMLVLAFVNLVRELLGLGKAKGSGAGPADIQLTQLEDPRVAMRRTLNIVGWILGFLAGFWLFGFSLTLAVLIFCYLKIQSREGWLISVTLTAGAWLIFWGLFDYTLRLPFPDGQVFLWLGG